MRFYLAAFTLVSLCATQAQAGESKGTPKSKDMPKYINMLKTSQIAKDRALAADMIGNRGAIQLNDVKDAVPTLQTSVIKDIDANVRRACAEALGKLATDPENSVPPLKDALKDKNLQVNLAAVMALGNFGPEAREAVPALREFSKTQKDKKTMKMIAEVIGKISGKKKKT